MKKREFFQLLALVFLISWLGILPKLLIAHGVNIPEWSKSFEIFMTLGPLLGTSIFIYFKQGKEDLKNLFKRLLIFKTKPSVIVIAILIPILIGLIAASLGLYLTGSLWQKNYTLSNVALNGILLTIAYLFLNTEEIAWRGVVFDSLIKRHSFFKACLFLAPIWWIFHLPLFLFPDGHPAAYGLLEFTFIVIGQTLILGWIYTRSNRSLVYVHMHHQLMNGFGQAFPLFPVFIAGNLVPMWLFCGLMLFLGVFLLAANVKEEKHLWQ